MKKNEENWMNNIPVYNDFATAKKACRCWERRRINHCKNCYWFDKKCEIKDDYLIVEQKYKRGE